MQEWSPINQWTWADAPADAGAYTVYVYARDGRHASAGGFDSALGAPFVLLSANQPPQLTALTPDRAGPQAAGSTVRWTAAAQDSDRDQILYRFWLKGPATGNAWKIVQDWSTKNQWTWTSAPADVGDYRIYVYARDGFHAAAGGYDSAVGQTYTLNNPLAARSLFTGTAIRDKPSLIFSNDGFLMAFQSWELGSGQPGRHRAAEARYNLE